MIIIGVIFIGVCHPIILAFCIIFLSLGFSVYLYKVIGEYWYRYIIILVVLRGVMVVFIYIARLIPNEEFDYIKVIILILFLLVMVGLVVEGIRLMGRRFLSLVLWISLIKEFNLFIVSFLLYIIIGVVYISRIKDGNII